MPSPNLSFDHRNLPAASLDSSSNSHSLGSDLRERRAAHAQCGCLAREVLKALDYEIGVLWIQLDAVAGAARKFGCDEGGARSKEWVVNHGATLGVVEYRAAHQLDRLLGGMIALLLLG